LGKQGARNKIITAVGDLNRIHVKGWDLLIPIFAEVATSHSDWRLQIAGGGEEGKKTLIELNEIEKNAYATQIKTRMELNGIISSIEKFNGTKEQEKQKIDELNSKYGSIFGAYNNLAQWYDVLINKGDAYINSLFAQAKAQSYIQKAMEAEQKIRDIKANGIESYRPTWGAGGKVYQFFGGGKKNQYGSDPAELAYNAALAQAENEKSNALKNAES
jgi:glycosyltransferase involved in cell wall biosynthesis